MHEPHSAPGARHRESSRACSRARVLAGSKMEEESKGLGKKVVYKVPFLLQDIISCPSSTPISSILCFIRSNFEVIKFKALSQFSAYNHFIMPRKPILIFVPGAGHTIETWDKVSTLLAAQKFECIPITLPSATGDVTAGLGDDVQAVRNAITAETTQGHDVVLVVHSYGGAVGQSAIKNLTIPKLGCEKEEGKGYVIGMVMLASGFGITGMSFIDGLGGTPPPTWRVDPSGFAEFTLIIPTRELFYHDLPVEEGDYWVSKLKKQSLKSLMEGGE